MLFYYKCKKKEKKEPKISYKYNLEEINTLQIKKEKHLNYICNDKGKIFFGDIINNYKGLYYSVNISGNRIEFNNDKFNMLPVYYYTDAEDIIVTNDYKRIVANTFNLTENKNFHNEQAIIFCNLDGRTYYNEVYRLSFGSSIIIDEELTIKKKYRFYDFFTEQPTSFSNSIKGLVDLFINNSEDYLEQNNAVTLTGGFDGRSIVSLNKYFGNNFTAYSYGKNGSGDVDNPKYLSKKLCFKYNLIELSNDYVTDHYEKCLREYLWMSGGIGGAQYPHSLYYAKQVSEEHDVLVTGYLGSELFASPKGASDEILPKLALIVLKNEEINITKEAQNLRSYGFDITNEKLLEIKETLIEYFESLPVGLLRNQRLACLMYEHIFMNSFSNWIFNTMMHIRVRVPFLDEEFFTKTALTKVSQFYEGFLETRLSKRIRGQKFYPVLMNKTYPQISRIISSKGYAPNDMLTFFGLIKMIANKKMGINSFKESNGIDKLCSVSGCLKLLKDSNDKNYNFYKSKIIENIHNRKCIFIQTEKKIFEEMIKELR